MASERAWACMTIEQRNFAVLDAVLEGQPLFVSPPPPDAGKKPASKDKADTTPEPAAHDLSLCADVNAAPRDIVEHLASDGFGVFYAEWKARADLAAQRYAGLLKPSMVLLATPDVSPKAGLAPKDGVKLMDDIVRETPMVDPASDVSNATVERAAAIVQANIWKVNHPPTPAEES